MFTERTIHKVGRIDQIVRDYFKNNPSVKDVPEKDLMQLFIEKGIFNKDYSRPGLTIRRLLRQLDADNRLSLVILKGGHQRTSDLETGRRLDHV
jgi:hypothetical protein